MSKIYFSKSTYIPEILLLILSQYISQPSVLKSFALHSLKWAVLFLDILSANNTSSPISNPITKTATRLAETKIIEYPTCLIFLGSFIYVKSITVEFNLFKSEFIF